MAGNAAPVTPRRPIVDARSVSNPGRWSMNFRRKYVTRISLIRLGVTMWVYEPVRLCTRTSVMSASGSATGLPYEPVVLVPLLLM
jgi:hypothetical protein